MNEKRIKDYPNGCRSCNGPLVICYKNGQQEKQEKVECVNCGDIYTREIPFNQENNPMPHVHERLEE